MRLSSLRGRSIRATCCAWDEADGFWRWSHCFAYTCLYYPKLLQKEKEGNLYNACLPCLSSPCADQPRFWPRSWVWFLTTQAILMIHWWCNQLRQLMLMNCIQYRSHATTAGGVKTYLWNRQLFDIKIRNVVIRNFLCVLVLFFWTRTTEADEISQPCTCTTEAEASV